MFDLERLARDKPQMLAVEALSEFEIDVLYTLFLHRGIIRGRPPPGEVAIREFVIGLGMYAGFIPSKRQPLPGTLKIWQGYTYYQAGLEYAEAMKRSDPMSH